MTQIAIGEMKLETQKLCQMLLETPEGEVLTYESVRSRIGIDIQNGHRGLLYTARKHAERENKCIYSVVIGEGIKRLDAAGSAASASVERSKLQRRARRALKRTANVKWDELTKEQKDALNVERTLLHFASEATTEKKAKVIANAVSTANDSLTYQKTLELFTSK